MKISQLIGSVAIASTIAATTAFTAPLSANAVSFSNIAGADTVGDSLAQYLSMDVTASGSGTLFKFNFANNPTPFTTAFIGKVFIEGSTSMLGASTPNIDNIGNVNFTGGLSNDQLPQGGNTFNTTYAFTRVTGGGNKFGVQETESLGVLFASANFNSVIAAIESGDLRVGYHVQAIGSGSDSYINTPPTKPVPVPGFLLGVMAAGAFGGSRLLKKKQLA